MTRLRWNLVENRRYEGGIDRGVLYRNNVPGIPWNGLVSVEESLSDNKINSYYMDGVKYLETVEKSDFVANVKAYSMPNVFGNCLGDKQLRPGVYLTGQVRESFGLSYRTLINENQYKLHIIYNATASWTERSSKTVASVADPSILGWTITTIPPSTNLFRPTAHIVLDSIKLGPDKMAEIERILYGSDVDGGSSNFFDDGSILDGGPITSEIFIDGGSVSTPSSLLDGGLATDTTFDQVIDSGFVDSAIEIGDVVDGGVPSSSETEPNEIETYPRLPTLEEIFSLM